MKEREEKREIINIARDVTTSKKLADVKEIERYKEKEIY